MRVRARWVRVRERAPQPRPAPNHSQRAPARPRSLSGPAASGRPADRAAQPVRMCVGGSRASRVRGVSGGKGGRREPCSARAIAHAVTATALRPTRLRHDAAAPRHDAATASRGATARLSPTVRAQPTPPPRLQLAPQLLLPLSQLLHVWAARCSERAVHLEHRRPAQHHEEQHHCAACARALPTLHPGKDEVGVWGSRRSSGGRFVVRRAGRQSARVAGALGGVLREGPPGHAQAVVHAHTPPCGCQLQRYQCTLLNHCGWVGVWGGALACT